MTVMESSLDLIPQTWHLVTEIPGPLSIAAIKRRNEAVSAGLGTAIPIVVKRAQDAIIEDLDGNRIIDLGAGIGVVNVGNFDKKLGVSIELKLGLTDTLTNLTQYEKYCKTLENYTRCG